jgi:hypothetical protein
LNYTHSTCRPDVKAHVVDPTIYTNLVGEVKPIVTKTCREKVLTNLYRIALFSKICIDDYNLDNILSFQCIGKVYRFFFYYYFIYRNCIGRDYHHILYHDKTSKCLPFH